MFYSFKYLSGFKNELRLQNAHNEIKQIVKEKSKIREKGAIDLIENINKVANVHISCIKSKF